ncbi:MAG: lipopolysaccharide kinase InaA family protein [Pseudomonadales bacterium]
MTGPADVPALSLAAVASAGRTLDAPFALTLAGAGANPAAALTVRCVSVLRLLPGRRLVAGVEVAGTSAVLKLFLGGGARRYCQRERRGCALLAAAGVATPTVLDELCAPAGSAVAAYGLLFEYLPEARPLDAADDAGVAAAAAELGRLHEHGCRHRDLHLDNFLRVAGSARPFVIDGDAVRRSRTGPLSPGRSRDDLAVFCAQRSALADRRLEPVLESYAQGRGWPPERARGERLVELAAAVRRQRRARLRRYRRKCQRDCSEFVCERGWRRYRVAVRAAWEEGLADLVETLWRAPESVFDGAEILKAGNSATVIRVPLGAGSCVVKRYNLKGPWHALRRNLRGMTRFRRSWVYGQALNLLEIPGARPLALMERRFGPLRGVAYLILSDLGSTDLAGEVDRVGLADERLEQVVQLFRSLQAAGLSHGDTKATNFLVSGGKLHLVDLDAMRDGAHGLADDAARFLDNFAHLPEVRERVRIALAKVPGIDLRKGAGR